MQIEDKFIESMHSQLFAFIKKTINFALKYNAQKYAIYFHVKVNIGQGQVIYYFTEFSELPI